MSRRPSDSRALGSDSRLSHSLPSQETVELGSFVGPWRLDVRLGAGAMGTVYKATHMGTGAIAAVKLPGVDVDPDGLTRFEREVAALGELDHPNLVGLVDHGAAGGRRFLAMEFVDGEPLDELLESRPPALEELVDVFQQLADALAALHDADLCHRDVKPCNIVIERATRRPVLVDFGLVKGPAAFDGEMSGSLTRAGETLGTLPFMAPEQVEMKGALGRTSPKTDSFGLGATLYHALTGRSPFGESSAEIVARLLGDGRPVPPSSLNPEVPAGLDAICLACLQRDPDQRPSCDELARRLLTDWREAGRSGLIPVLGVLVLLVAVGLGAWILQPPEPPRLIELKVPEAVRSEDIEISGQVANPAPLELRIETGKRVDSRPIKPDEAGRFALTLSLPEGRSRLILLPLTDEAEPLTTREVLRDSTAPTIKLDKLPEAPSFLVIGAESPLRGQVTDSSETRLVVAGESLPLDEEGRFSWSGGSLVRDGLKALELVATDALGNVTRLEVEGATASGLSAARKALERRRGWNRAAKSLQDLAIRDVLRRLGPDFAFIETRVWTCGAESHRIGAFRHRGTGIRLHLLPGGTYTMGGRRAARNLPRHEVTLPSFLCGATEVTQEQWDRVGGTDQRRFRGPRLPIEKTTFEDMRRWLVKAGGGLRLPSESEWEYACRGGSTTIYPWGDTPDDEWFWHAGNTKTPRSVELHRDRSNAFGLSDMAGNVRESCEDAWIEGYETGPYDERPRIKSGDPQRVVRGGSYLSRQMACQSGFRSWVREGFAFSTLGLRVVVSIPPAR